MNKIYQCPLCKNPGKEYAIIKTRVYYHCNNCDGIFCHPNSLLNSQEEFLRYQKHNNDVNDKGYQKFVSPITESILANFNNTHKGLDFGAGKGPVITKLLRDNSFNIIEYDPYFFNNPNLLNNKYDYIACCEVVEHFYNPQKEFNLLKNILSPNGKLFIMTDLYNKEIDFNSWYYVLDPTHVFFYTHKTFDYIMQFFGFKKLEIYKRLVILDI